MSKKKKTPVFENKIDEVLSHYVSWREDNDTRRTRKNGWNDVTDCYWGKLPSDWPYLSKVVDPVLRTTLTEKNSRLLNAKLRGRLVPREGGDVLKARLNNAILEYQWDTANYGGSMLAKWAMMDIDTRLYGSKFGVVYWRYCTDDKGKVTFDGNEFKPLDIRNCGMDPKATHIRDAKWFQYRTWEYLEDLEKQNEYSKDDEKMYPGLEKLKYKMQNKSDRRDSEYESRIHTLKGLDDKVGQDKVFPVVELVREIREDRVVIFSPKYKVVLSDKENVYKRINVVQLRYYPLGDDPIGESEVEPVIGLWRGIQATLCGFLDNMNIHMRPPVKILDGRARMETIVWGPEAQWLVDSVDAVTEHQTNGEAMRYFQTTYGALKAAFSTAMGDMSQGTSAVDPFEKDKTATEIKHVAKQQNSRDQNNQMYLAEALQDMMSMWLSNNQRFLFSDPTKKEHVLRIVGSNLFEYFKRAGLDEMEVTDDSMQAISQIISAQEGNVSDEDIVSMLDAGKTPRFPVITNPEATDPNELIAKPKMMMNDMEDGAELSIVPEDLEGTYDYIPDVRSMSSGADQEIMSAQQRAIDRVTNPQVVQQLLQEGVRPSLKELLISEFENTGLKDAERFFPTIETQPGVQEGLSSQQNIQQPGVPGVPQAPLAQQGQQPMAGPSPVQNTGGVPMGVPGMLG